MKFYRIHQSGRTIDWETSQVKALLHRLAAQASIEELEIPLTSESVLAILRKHACSDLVPKSS